jgi:hypothetical protein
MSLRHPTAAAVAVFGTGDEGRPTPAWPGHKAADLARLIALGFPVPPGVVVSTDVVDRIRALGMVPEDFCDRLALALGNLGRGPTPNRGRLAPARAKDYFRGVSVREPLADLMITTHRRC